MNEMVKEKVIDWFCDHINLSKDEVLENIGENYFDKEYLDSFAFIEFISDMESTFNIEFDHDQFENRNFSTIKGMIEIISKMTEGVENA